MATCGVSPRTDASRIDAVPGCARPQPANSCLRIMDLGGKWGEAAKPVGNACRYESVGGQERVEPRVHRACPIAFRPAAAMEHQHGWPRLNPSGFRD